MIRGHHVGTCPVCAKRVEVDDFGYAVGHDAWNDRLRVRETCMGTQEVANPTLHHAAVKAFEKAQTAA